MTAADQFVSEEHRFDSSAGSPGPMSRYDFFTSTGDALVELIDDGTDARVVGRRAVHIEITVDDPAEDAWALLFRQFGAEPSLPPGVEFQRDARRRLSRLIDRGESAL